MKVPGFDFIVYHNGECVYRDYRGHSDYEGKVKMNGKERYNIYSASKIVTCTTALKLFESGAFKLDDPLYLYMPEFREMSVRVGSDVVKAKNPITVKNLFTMTAGFNYNTDSAGIKAAIDATGGKCPTRKVIEYMASDPLSFEPGTNWCYSLCHDVLAAFVEVVSGERFGEYARKNVFEPLGMNSTTYNLPDSELDTLMAQYRYDDVNRVYNVCPTGKGIMRFKFGPEYESGGAGCISTVEDRIKLEEALRVDDKILKAETLRMMTSNQLTERQFYYFQKDRPRIPGYGYGLGVWVGVGIPGREDFGWTGAAAAFHCVNRVHGYSAYFGEHVLNAPNFPTSLPLRALLAEAFIERSGKGFVYPIDDRHGSEFV